MASFPAATVLLVPGYTNSGPDHWQTLWQKANLNYQRVQQDSWNKPTAESWIWGVQKAIALLPGPIIIVAHSCGSVATVGWAATHDTQKVAAALLVAPGDVDDPDALLEIRPLGPMPTNRLPFPSILVVSDNDPYLKLGRARHFSNHWGSKLMVVQGAGHIHTAAGYGPWPFGEKVLRDLAQDVGVLIV